MACPKLWYLKSSDLFEGIPKEEIENVAVKIELKECDKECIIYSPVDETEHIFIVNKGEVYLYHEKNGKKFIFDTLGPGSVFGSIKSAKKSPYGHFAKGKPGLCVCVFPVQEFLEMISKYPNVTLRFLNRFSEQIADYQEKLRQKHENAEEIIFNELKRLKRKRQKGFLDKWFNRPLRATHEEIADFTGLNRVTVTKAMKKLKEAKKIRQDNRTGIIEFDN